MLILKQFMETRTGGNSEYLDQMDLLIGYGSGHGNNNVWNCCFKWLSFWGIPQALES